MVSKHVPLLQVEGGCWASTLTLFVGTCHGYTKTGGWCQLYHPLLHLADATGVALLLCRNHSSLKVNWIAFNIDECGDMHIHTAMAMPVGSFLASEIKASLYQELRRAWWTRLTFCRHPVLLFPCQLGRLRQPLSAETLRPALFFVPFSSLSPLRCRCIVYEVYDSADGGCCCLAGFKGRSGDDWRCIFTLCPLSHAQLHATSTESSPLLLVPIVLTLVSSPPAQGTMNNWQLGMSLICMPSKVICMLICFALS